MTEIGASVLQRVVDDVPLSQELGLGRPAQPKFIRLPFSFS